MAGIKADGPKDDDLADVGDDTGGESDNMDDSSESGAHLEGVKTKVASASSKLGEMDLRDRVGSRFDDVDLRDRVGSRFDDVDLRERFERLGRDSEDDGDEGPSLTERFVEDAKALPGEVSETLEELDELIEERLDDSSDAEVAELVDGATVYFIDSAARSKSIDEYGLVVIDAAQYPEPIILKNDQPVEISEGAVLSAARGSTLIKVGEKRVVTRTCILVSPERAREVRKEDRVELPRALAGETIPARANQSEDFYHLVVNAVASST